MKNTVGRKFGDEVKMYKLRDRRELAKKITDWLQELVYGDVVLDEDIMFQKFIIHITDRDINFSCDISGCLYKIENERDMEVCIDDIFTDYKRMILGKYIV